MAKAGQAGFSLLELLVTMAVSISLLTGAMMFSADVRQHQRLLLQQGQALRLAEQQLALWRQTPFTSLGSGERCRIQRSPSALQDGLSLDYELCWRLSYQDATRKGLQLTVSWPGGQLVMESHYSSLLLPPDV